MNVKVSNKKQINSKLIINLKKGVVINDRRG